MGGLAVVALVAAACGSAATPAPSPTAGPTATAPLPTPSAATASPAASVRHDVVYLAQDRLPPVAVPVEGAGAGLTDTARVLSRVRALFAAPPRPPLWNAASTSRARPNTARIDGEVATVDFAVPAGDWGIGGSTAVRAFLQQLIYTITEEPGVRRALVTENGGTAVIGGEGLVVDHAASREDVSGYVSAATDALAWRSDVRTPAPITLQLVEGVAPGLSRFLIDTGSWGAKANIGFQVRPMRTDERAFPDLGKWTLSIAVMDVTTADDAVRVIDRTPVRAIRRTSTATGVRYDIGLDDLRPWRVALLYEPLRLIVDVGGDPDAVSANIGLYRPVFGSTVRVGDEMSGTIRAFEGQFEYRVTDAIGAVTVGHATASLGTADLWGTFHVALPEVPPGPATLELRLVSPKDGSVREQVFTSFAVAR